MVREKYDVAEIKVLQERINSMNPVDIAEEFKNLTESETALYIRLLDKDLMADSFAALSKERKIKVLDSLSDEKTRELIRELDEDELVDTIQELPANMVRKLMQHFADDSRRDVVNELLGYSEDSVGSVMSVNFLSVKISDSPKVAVDKVLASELDGNKLELIWITDDSLILTGYVYLADLIRNLDKDIEEFLYPVTAKVFANDDQEILAKLSYKYNLDEIPVTDSESRLIGVVPAEWTVDIMYREYSEDMSNIHGIADSKGESYFEKSAFSMAKDRTAWLVICLITATLTSFIIQRYEAILAASVVLTAYIPMLMDAGGNAGTQSSTTLIQALYTSEIGFKDIVRVIIKEAEIGLLAGFALVFVNVLRMFLLDGTGLGVNLTVSITLLLTVVLSKIIGGVLPLIAEKLKIDPTVMAGPLITTVVDTFALLIYFEVASFLLGI